MSSAGWEAALDGAVERYDRVGGGLRVHSLHWPGAGRAVVLVHGMVVAGRSLVEAAAVLAGSGLDVHVPDLPGFGLSDKPVRALGVEGLAQGLAGWIRGRSLEGCLLVGNSFGTQVAAAVAAGHEGVVGGLALVAPTIDPKWRRWVPAPLLRGSPGADPLRARRRSASRVLAQMLASPRSTAGRPSLRRLIRTEYVAAGPGRALATYRYALADRIEDRLPLIRVPVLVARGSEDSLVTEQWAHRLAGLAPSGACAAIPGATHDAEFERPDLWAGAVRAWLEGLTPPG